MRQETFTYSNGSATVRSRTRRTSIISAQYAQSLRKLYPEMVEFEQSLYTLTAPTPVRPDTKLPVEVLLAKRATYDEQFQAYLSEVARKRAQYPVGAALADQTNAMIPLLSRVTELKGLNFNLTAGVLTESDLQLAFESFLDNSEFWDLLAETITKVDEPLTPAAIKPPEDLTEAEAESPLSERVGDASNNALKSTSSR